MTANAVSSSIDDLSNPVIEAYFEMVRLKCFSHLPSRFQTLFAIDYKKDIDDWPELIKSKKPYKVFEIEAPSSVIHKFDSNLLTPRINTRDGKYELVPHAIMANAHRYWAKKASKSPRYELLLRLPVTVGKEIYCSSNHG